MKLTTIGKGVASALTCAAVLYGTAVSAQNLTSNSTGTNNGFYYTFWKDSGDASMGLQAAGRYTSQWTNSTNNWVGGKGWNPGNSSRVVSYSGNYGVDNSQNSYLAFYGWTRSPLIEYYVIESYGSYNPSSCSGGTDYGSFQSDGATYNVRRCLRTQQPSIDGTQTFYQYFSVRSPKKGFGNISGTITFANHANFWASKGLALGNHDYQVLATEGYQSRGSSDITVSQGTSGGGTSSTPTTPSSSSSSVATGGGNTGGGVVVRARGVAGGEHINLRVGGATVASWNLTTSFQDLTYTGTASGDIQVQYDNDGGSRDAVVDYIRVNGETRQAEDMTHNTAYYTNGSCGGGGNSELMHCNGVIGFGYTYDCFSGSCSGGSTGGGTGSSSSSGSGGGNTNCSGYVGITFDDGPGANSTTLVNLLKQNNLTPVTWFVQGNYVASNTNLIQTLLSVGEIQNHSYTHPHLINLSYQQIYDELNRTNQAIQSAGAPKPTIFRPPYGEVNTNVNQAAQNLGLRVVTWNVDSQDWNGASAAAIANAANQLQNGQVILMHDANYNNTNAAIPQIAANLRAKGLCPGRIDASTGRAVAPSGGTASSTPAVSSSSRSSTPVVASSRASSSVATGGACQCNWWGTRYPICTTTASGWGWENNRSCITTSTCNSQGTGGGGVVCN
jgi:peptidoglycan/xylan/chitin deacetylase (PgdA/CDA1 family)